MKDKVKKLLIHEDINIKSAMKSMDLAGEKILFVIDAQFNLLGSLTDGDVRRWILKEGSLLESIFKIYNPYPKSIGVGYELAQAKRLMSTHKVGALPVKDGNQLVDVLFWEELFFEQARPARAVIDVPVLIMSGGKGTRLDPFTRILPKPLIPIGEKTIVETIMDRFSEFGCKDFYLTVNYKGKMIQAYFDSDDTFRHNIHFLYEEAPLGTAGSIRLIEKTVDVSHFFVTNCDILVEGDYSDLFEFHRAKNNDITIVGSIQHIAVPYGVLKTNNGGNLESIVEKPEYDLLVNTGMYVLKREVIKRIPENKHYDFTTLIEDIKKEGGTIGVYPISQKSWMDVGQWQEYQTTLRRIEG